MSLEKYVKLKTLQAGGRFALYRSTVNSECNTYVRLPHVV